LDEPLTGVHDTLRNDIYELLREVAQNKCVLVIEHDASDHLFDFSIDI
jgi:ABC-type Mn2+/Zn2+ transport system ATPase subunit